jgi:hypothetical protein
MVEASFENRPEFFSLIAKNSSQQNQKQYIKNIIRDSFDFVARYLNFLPAIDQDIAKLYYVDGLSQDQIKKLFGVCQAAISRRVKFIFVRIKFLLRMPSLNPIQVREDLRILFDDELFEFAYFFYWELAQNRVKYYIETSQSGAANKLIKIIAYLKKLKDLEIKEGDSEMERKKFLSLVYLDYFEFIYRRSNVITWVFKKSDKYRNQPVFIGDPII